MKRLLVVAFGVPPTRGPNAPRAWHLARHLPALGWEAIVLTPRHPQRHLKVEKTHEHTNYPIPLRLTLEPSGVPFWLQETGYRDLLESSRRSGERREADQGLPGLYGRQALGPDEIALEPPPEPRNLADRMNRWLRCNPDEMAGWISPGLLAARALSRAVRPDAVYSVSPPVSAHRIAMRVAENLRIPWIADFREPWRGAAPGLVDAWRAHRILKKATIASLASSVLQLPPSFDESDLTGSHDSPLDRLAHSSPVVLVHAGPTAVRGRDPILLLQAVRLLIDSGSPAASGIRIRFLGAQDPRLAAAIGTRALNGIVTREPPVPWQVSLETQADASVLLLALGPGDGGRIPDRALEALTVRRPLIAFGSPHASVRAFLSSTRVGSLQTEAGPLATAIEEAISHPFSLNEDSVAPHRAENVVGSLVEALTASKHEFAGAMS
jgi:hypothetical protein